MVRLMVAMSGKIVRMGAYTNYGSTRKSLLVANDVECTYALSRY
jgi:hypothetical protein